MNTVKKIKKKIKYTRQVENIYTYLRSIDGVVSIPKKYIVHVLYTYRSYNIIRFPVQLQIAPSKFQKSNNYIQKPN